MVKSTDELILSKIKNELVRIQWFNYKDHYALIRVYEKHDENFIIDNLTKMRLNVTPIPIQNIDGSFITEYYITW